MNNVFKLLAPLILVGALLTGCVEERIYSPDGFRLDEIKLVSPSGEEIELVVEVAETADQRRDGLMGRTELRDGHGMFFIFDSPNRLSFWMKNTLIPLDVIFFDENGKYVSSTSMVPCEADPCQKYSAEGDALYALEVGAGFLGRVGVEEGWRLVK